MFSANLLFIVIMPLLVSSFYNSVLFAKHESAVKIHVPTSETSLHAKITPNQGESMDMYRKVSYSQIGYKHLQFLPLPVLRYSFIKLYARDR